MYKWYTIKNDIISQRHANALDKTSRFSSGANPLGRDLKYKFRNVLIFRQNYKTW